MATPNFPKPQMAQAQQPNAPAPMPQMPGGQFMDPMNQFFMTAGAGMMGQGYSPTPTNAFTGIQNALGAGQNAYQNALVLQNEQKDRARELAKEQSEQQKARQMKQQFEKSVQGLPPQQQQALRIMYQTKPEEALKVLWDLQNPQGEKPTAEMRNTEANVQRLKAAGLWEGLTKAQQANVIGGVPLEKVMPAGTTIEFDPETKGFKFSTGGPAGAAPGETNVNTMGGMLPEEARKAGEEFTFQDQVSDFIFDPLLDRAVGPRWNIMEEKLGIDWMTDSPEYRLRARIKTTLEPQVLAMGGENLKGSQTEKEWEMVRNTMPDESASPAAWRDWYSGYMAFRLKAYDSDSEAYDQMKEVTRERMLQQPMRRTDAARWLKPGDIFIDVDTGKRTEYLGD